MKTEIALAVLVVVVGMAFFLLVIIPGVESDCRARGGDHTRWQGLAHLCLTADGRVL